ncbi:MAG TPA: hypothetical protein VJR02_16870 [Pyrinomonadaceae bacterium]|nr:hypothetical protein [Pyrinomonadaceae bacterium]
MLSRLLMLTLVFGLCFSVSAQQEREPFEFVETGTLTLAAGQDNKVQILNNKAMPLVLTIHLIDSSTTGAPLLSSVVEFEPKVMQLPSAGGGAIVLRIKPNHSLAPGSSLAGYLVISEGGSGTLLRKAVSFEVPDQSAKDKSKPLKSLTASLTSTVYFWPFFEKGIVKPAPLPVSLPLSSNDTPDVIKNSLAGKPVARLVMETGETALVSYEGATAELPGGTSGVVLGFTGSGVAGQYAGELLPIKVGENQPVKLTVIFKHHWIYAAGMILIGIALYYLMRAYLNVGRRVLELREQQAQLDDAFSRAVERFKESAKGKPYAGDSIQLDFEMRSEALLVSINGLKKKNLIRLDESGTDYKTIIEELSKLNSVAQDWSRFAESKLNPLSEALKDSQLGFATRPSDTSITDQVPAIAIQATATLESHPGPMSILQFETRKAKIEELLPRLSGWRTLNSRVATLERQYAKFVKGPDFAKLDQIQQETLKSNWEQALVIWRKLWTRPAVDIDINSLDQSLFGLEDSLAVITGITTLVPATSAAAKEADAVPLREREDAERIAHIGRKRFAWDLFYLGLVTAIATYGGLTTLYFGHPFGAVKDYFEAFVVGFSTKPLIDVVALAINKFTSRGA